MNLVEKIKKVSKVKSVLCLFAFLFSQSIHANLAADNSYKLSDHFHWDQSQDVLFENFQSSTYALQVLQNKDKFKDHDFIFGGLIEADLQHWQGDDITEAPDGNIYSDGNGLYVSQATFDVMNKWNSWITAFASGADSYVASNNPDGDVIYSPNAFVAWGNLDRFPFYLITGIATIPFGVFTESGPWDIPLTEAYFNPAQAPQISAGFYDNGWNVVAAEFNDQTNYENHAVFSLFYNKTWDHSGFGVGIGYLTDLKANATSSSNFRRNSARSFSQLNTGDMGNIADINGNINYRALTLNAEYDQGNNVVNGNTGNPDAYSVVLNVEKEIAGKKTIFGAGYSATKNLRGVPNYLAGNDGLSLALAGLKAAWSLNVARPIFTKNIILAFDYQRITTNADLINLVDQYSNTYTLDLTAYL